MIFSDLQSLDIKDFVPVLAQDNCAQFIPYIDESKSNKDQLYLIIYSCEDFIFDANSFVVGCGYLRFGGLDYQLRKRPLEKGIIDQSICKRGYQTYIFMMGMNT